MAIKDKTLAQLRAEDALNNSGLERFDPKDEEGGITFLKILSPLSKEVEDYDMKPGVLIAGKSRRIIAEFDEDFEFIPVCYFKDWTIWDDGKIVKRSLKKADFSEAELAWREGAGKDGKSLPPLAQESHNFVVVLPNEYESAMMLSFNKSDFKVGKIFRELTIDKLNQEGLPLYGSVYKTRVIKNSDGKNNWFGLSKVKFVKEIEDLEEYKTLKQVYAETDKAVALIGKGSQRTPQLAEGKVGEKEEF